MATTSDINTLCESASTSMDSGEFNAAIVLLMRAKALLASVADNNTATHGNRWDRGSIDSLIDECKDQRDRLLSAGPTGMLQLTNMTYKRAT